MGDVIQMRVRKPVDTGLLDIEPASDSWLDRAVKDSGEIKAVFGISGFWGLFLALGYFWSWSGAGYFALFFLFVVAFIFISATRSKKS